MKTYIIASFLFAGILGNLAAEAPPILNYQGRVAVGGVNFSGTGQFKFALVDGGTNPARTATATATRNSDFITSVAVFNGGSGYTSQPAITFIGGGGSGAAATATVSLSGGVVTEISITNPGSGYTSLPKVIIADPAPNNMDVTLWSNNGTGTNGSEPTAAVPLAVTKGLYSVLLGDATLPNMIPVPASVFTNPDVRLRVWFNNGTNGSQLLTPDQRIASAGYALAAASVSGDGALLDGGNLSLPATTATTGIIRSGFDPLLHTFGSNNLFVGVNAGNFTMFGNGNTACGGNALGLNINGSTNTAIGDDALFSNLSGSFNTASGNGALFSNTGGDFNTASGAKALGKNTTGHSNTAIGINALGSNTTGTSNIAIGFGAGGILKTGSRNIAIGTSAAAAGEAETIRLGDLQTRTFVAGIRGRTTGSNNAIPVLIDSNGQLGTVSSSRRYKEDIRDMAEANTGEALMRLRPVTFRYKEAFDDGQKPLQYGLIAEEVAAVFPDLTVFNDEGQPETVKYHLLAPLLLQEVQQQQMKLQEKDRQIGDLNDRLDALEALIAGMAADTDAR